MAYIKADRIKEVSASVGTGPFVMAGAVTKYRPFSVVMANSDDTHILIEHANATLNEWEICATVATVSGGTVTLSRGTVLSSSNNGNRVTFSVGTKYVSMIPPADSYLRMDANGDLAITRDLAVGRNLTVAGTASIAGALNMNSQRINNLLDPSSAQDAATKFYVDATVQGLDAKPTARLATAAALPACTYANGTAGVGATLTADANGALTVDGVAVAVNDLILVKNQASAFQNGLYVVTQTGSAGAPFILTRSTDFNSAGEVPGAFIPVGNEGTANANSLWLCNPSGAVTMGTTNLPFTQLNGATALIAGSNITISGNTISVSTSPALSGTVSITGSLTLGDNGNRLQISSTGSGAVINQNDNSSIIFQTQGTERLRIGYTGTITAPGITVTTGGVYAAGIMGYTDSNFGMLSRPRIAGAIYSWAVKSSDDARYLIASTDAGAVSVPGTLNVGSTLTGVTGNFSASVTGTGAISALRATNGGGTGQTSIYLYQEGAATNQKAWEILAAATSGEFILRTINDAYDSSSEAIRFTRGSGNTIASATITPPLTLTGALTAAAATLSGKLTVSSNTYPQLLVQPASGTLSAAIDLISTGASARNWRLISGDDGWFYVYNITAGSSAAQWSPTNGMQLNAALTYGGATFNNATTGATGGNLVGSNSPTIHNLSTSVDVNGYALIAGRYSAGFGRAALNTAGNYGWEFQVNGAARLQLDAGTATFNTNVVASGGQVIAGTYGLVQHDGSHMYVRPTNGGNLYLGANNTNYVTLASTGQLGLNVGDKTSSAYDTIYVQGTTDNALSNVLANLSTGNSSQVRHVLSLNNVANTYAIWGLTKNSGTPYAFLSIGAGVTGGLHIEGEASFTTAVPVVGTRSFGDNTTRAASTAFVQAALSNIPLRGYISGYEMSKNSNTVLDVAAGSATDSSNTLLMTLAAGSINCGTTGANGLDTGSLANSTWYHVFIIGKTDGTVARLASTSLSSPTMPSGYTLKRRIGSFLTNGSAQIIAFLQIGDRFYWSTAVTDLNGPNWADGTDTLFTVTVPTGVQVVAMVSGFVTPNVAAGWGLDIYSPSTTRGAQSYVASSGAAQQQSGYYAEVLTNTSAQLKGYAVISGGSLFPRVNTIGWIDNRGREG